MRTALGLLVAAALLGPVQVRAAPANTVQWQPLPALAGVASLRYERGLGEIVGVALHGALGEGNHMTTYAGRRYAEAGLQVRLYLLGTFADGVALGLGGAWLGLVDDLGYRERGLALGPKLASKFALWWGLTAELEVGGAWVRRTAEMRGGGELVASEWQPNANLGLGWTF